MMNGPPARQAHIWLALADQLSDAVLAEQAQLMSPTERTRHDAFKFDKDKRLFIIARAMARRLLSHYAGGSPEAWTFRENQWGRPEIDTPVIAPPLRFNLSHTKGLVACIVARERDIGIDVENTTRPTNILTIADSVFSATEIRDLKRLGARAQQRRFFELWTLKESYIKARGMGLAIPLDQFSFTFADGIDLAIDPALRDTAATWQLHLWKPTPSHQAALAIRRTGEDLDVVIRWSPPFPIDPPVADGLDDPVGAPGDRGRDLR